MQIQFESTTKSFWGKKALDDLNLVIEPGSLVAVLHDATQLRIDSTFWRFSIAFLCLVSIGFAAMVGMLTCGWMLVLFAAILMIVSSIGMAQLMVWYYHHGPTDFK